MPITSIILPSAPEQLIHEQMHSVQSNVVSPNIDSLILPFVLLWDPLNQFPVSFPQGLPCLSCSRPLTVLQWKLGQSVGLLPRVIHSIQYTVLVISTIYGCENKHTVVATDPRVLQFLSFQLPFVLHRTGFTKQFIECAINLVSEGLTIAGVEKYVVKSRRKYTAFLLLRV